EGACTPLADTVSTLWERRQEVAARLGLSGPDVIESPGPVVAAASAWLDRTTDLLEGPTPLPLAQVGTGALGGGRGGGARGRRSRCRGSFAAPICCAASISIPASFPPRSRRSASCARSPAWARRGWARRHPS